jgi:hypothetical protein
MIAPQRQTQHHGGGDKVAVNNVRLNSRYQVADKSLFGAERLRLTQRQTKVRNVYCGLGVLPVRDCLTFICG